MAYESLDFLKWFTETFPKGCQAREDNPYLRGWLCEAWTDGYHVALNKKEPSSINQQPQAGSEASPKPRFNWTSLNGIFHTGFVKEIDSNVIVIQCETCKKECCYES